MFTGIIESVGRIAQIEGNIFMIAHDFVEPFELGESVALSGMCATVIDVPTPPTPPYPNLRQGFGRQAGEEVQSFSVEIMEESRNKTIFGSIAEGDLINLERSAIIGARNSGHFVSGHVDECAEIVKREKIEDFECFRIKISPENRKFIVSKGSIAIDGISLTVSNVSKKSSNSKGSNSTSEFELDKADWCEVSIISHTLSHTTLGQKEVGDSVNIEYDILGKYVLNK